MVKTAKRPLHRQLSHFRNARAARCRSLNDDHSRRRRTESAALHRFIFCNFAKSMTPLAASIEHQRRMAVTTSPLKDRKGRSKLKDSVAESPGVKRFTQLPTPTKSKGRNIRTTKSLPLSVEIPTTPLLENFLGPIDNAAFLQVSLRLYWQLSRKLDC